MADKRFSVTITNTYEVWADDETEATKAAVHFDNGQPLDTFVQFTDGDVEVVEISKPELTRFLVTYHVNLVHDVEVNARDEEHAKEVFEQMYAESNGELSEYHDISHEVVDVEPTAMQ